MYFHCQLRVVDVMFTPAQNSRTHYNVVCVCVGKYPHSNRAPITKGTIGSLLLSQTVEQRRVPDCRCLHTCVCWGGGGGGVKLKGRGCLVTSQSFIRKAFIWKTLSNRGKKFSPVSETTCCFKNPTHTFMSLFYNFWYLVRTLVQILKSWATKPNKLLAK